MNISLRIDHDLDRITQELEGNTKAIDKVLRSALRSTLKTVRTQAVRISRQRYTYADKDRLSIANRFNFSVGLYEAELNFSGRRGVGLRHFRPSPTRPPNWRGVDPKKRKPPGGVTSIIIKGRGRKIYAGPNGEKPFWAKARQGFMALFYRKKGIIWQHGTKFKGKQIDNGLEMLFGPSPIQALGNVSKDKLEAITRETLSKNMDRALRATLRGYLR